ncbi:MAG TPA: hypothetical protein VMF89_04810, partial [Polyangiales bacterium]|nr:hypothetical protein [Polyangiales bacterium]
ALASGDLQGLIELLAESATMRTDHGGKASAARRILEGPNNIARFLHGLWNKRDQLPTDLQVLPRFVNGAPAVVLRVGDEVFSTITLRIERRANAVRITEIAITRNPDKLLRLRAALDCNELMPVRPSAVAPDR